MDKQDTRELSMDEILSSIRNILHDSGTRHQPKDDEYRAINISTMKTVAEAQPFVPLRPVISEPQVSEVIEEKLCEKLLSPDTPEGKKTFTFDYKDNNVVIDVK